jgi:hypothetical protein
MTKILALVALLSVTACGKKEQYADVDCGKLMDHFTDVAITDGMAGKPQAEIDAARAKMKDQRPTTIAACEKEKPTKKMTVAQYDCVMKATTMATLAACANQ